jgi:hypothetical protein
MPLLRSRRLRRAGAAFALAALPLTMGACAEEEPVDEEIVEEQEEDD